MFKRTDSHSSLPLHGVPLSQQIIQAKLILIGLYNKSTWEELDHSVWLISMYSGPVQWVRSLENKIRDCIVNDNVCTVRNKFCSIVTEISVSCN